MVCAASQPACYLAKDGRVLRCATGHDLRLARATLKGHDDLGRTGFGEDDLQRATHATQLLPQHRG